MGSALHRNMNLGLVDPCRNTHIAHVQASCNHDVCSGENIEDAMVFMSSLKDPGAHRPLSFLSNAPPFQQEPRLAYRGGRRYGERSTGIQRKNLGVIDVEDRALIYKRSPGLLNRDLCRRDLFHALES